MIDYIGRFVSSVSNALEFNQATLSGCIDVIVIEQEDGTLMCTPFHVRFGKLKVLKSKEKVVTLNVNGKDAGFTMKLGAAGDGFFEENKQPKLMDDVMSDDQSDPENYMSSEDDNSGMSSPRREDDRGGSPQIGPIKDEHAKPDKKWSWLWKSTPEDAVQSEKEKEEMMSEALEKLLKQELGDEKEAEKAEILADMENGPEAMRVPEVEGDSQHHIEKGKEVVKDLENGKEPHPYKEEEGEKEKEKGKDKEKTKGKDKEKEKEKEKEKHKEKGDKEEEVDEEKAKKDKKKGIIRSFLGMFKGSKDDIKLQSGRKAVSSTVQLPSLDSGKKKQKSKFGKKEDTEITNEETLTFPDAIENIDFSLDDEDDEKKEKKEGEKHNASEFPPDADIELSLCANHIEDKEDEDLTAIFVKHRVPYSKFLKDPFRILSNPDLMIKIDDKLYDWKVACPLIISLLAYKKPLPEEVLHELSNKESMSTSTSWKDWFSLSKKDEKNKKEKEKEEKEKEKEKPKKEDKTKSEEKSKTKGKGKKDENKEKTEEKDTAIEIKPVVQEQEDMERSDRKEQTSPPALEDMHSHPHQRPHVPGEEKPPMITEKQIIRENLAQEKLLRKADGDDDTLSQRSRRKRVRRTLRPNTEMLKTLDLKPGCNTITYTVQSGIQGEKSLTANIYLWPANSKIVLSDIDGTITKSDVLGQLMPMMGKDWTQPGVSSLYSNIRKNGYQILYLTARAIGQSQLTKNFLNSITQGGYSLPPGPVILSPDRLVPSFKREIIYRKPEVFKIACLRDLRSLFLPNHNPFYAGFGNRETDAIAYQAVGVPPGKIFTINTLGEIRLLNATYSKSYVLINDMVNDMFPGIEVDDKYQASEEYNLVNYFKVNYETLVDFDVSEIL